MIQNKETKRRYLFTAPHSLDGPDVVEVPFPAAASRRPNKEGVIEHDCNPAVVHVGEEDLNVLTARPIGIQPGSVMIVNNEKSEEVEVSGVLCPAGRTVLIFDGWGYQQISMSNIAEKAEKPKKPKGA